MQRGIMKYLVKIDNKVKLPRDVKRYLKTLLPLKGGEWDSKDPLNDKFKKCVKDQLSIIQNDRCAYCGLTLGTRGKHIDHFAPKGGAKRPKHVMYTYLTRNLFLACYSCNMTESKGSKDTIKKATKKEKALMIKLDFMNYKKREFTIVHPYFDNPDDHISWTSEDRKIIPSYLDEKGKKTIEMFRLDRTHICEERGKDYLYHNNKQSDDDEILIGKSLIYRPQKEM